MIGKININEKNRILNKKLLPYLLWISMLSFMGYSCHSGDSASMEISAEEYLKMHEQVNSVILDVRTSQEYERGHLPGAVLMDIYTPGTNERLNKLDPSKTYYVYCHSGARSRSIVYLMRKQGFAKSYNIKGGILHLGRAGATLTK